MFSSIKQPTRNPITRRQRGTAVTETMLIMVPVYFMFMLVASVLTYWERYHIDESVSFQSEMVKFNSTGPVWITGSEAMLYTFGGNQHYMKDVSNASAFNPSQYNVYVTDNITRERPYILFRKSMMSRGTNSWVSYPLLRGQYKGEEEWKKVESWLIEMGLQKVTDSTLQKKLMLGT